jgi:hypothetical protein
VLRPISTQQPRQHSLRVSFTSPFTNTLHHCLNPSPQYINPLSKRNPLFPSTNYNSHNFTNISKANLPQQAISHHQTFQAPPPKLFHTNYTNNLHPGQEQCQLKPPHTPTSAATRLAAPPTSFTTCRGAHTRSSSTSLFARNVARSS